MRIAFEMTWKFRSLRLENISNESGIFSFFCFHLDLCQVVVF